MKSLIHISFGRTINDARGVDGTLSEDGDESSDWAIRKIVYSLTSIHYCSSCVFQRIVRQAIHKFTAWA
jgi:hypothetical protein